MSYCINCGKELKGNEMFCGHCGEAVDMVPIQEEKKISKKKIGLIIGSAVLVVAIVAGGFLLSTPRKEEEHDNKHLVKSENYLEEQKEKKPETRVEKQEEKKVEKKVEKQEEKKVEKEVEQPKVQKQEYNVNIPNMSQAEFDTVMGDVSWYVEAIGEMHSNLEGMGDMIVLQEGDIIPFFDTNNNLYAAEFYPPSFLNPAGCDEGEYHITYYYTTAIHGKSDLIYTYITSGDNYAYCDRFISENGRLLRYLTGDGIAYDTVNSEQLMNMLPAEICFYEMGYEIAEMFPFN